MRVSVLRPLPRSVTRPRSLMRAISPDGTTERPWTITVSGDKRLVEANSPRYAVSRWRARQLHLQREVVPRLRLIFQNLPDRIWQ